MKHAKSFLAILFISLCSASAYAQFQTGIQGLARDTSGAGIPGVAVTLTNVDTGATRSAMTNESGFYTFPSLPGGHYELRAELVGFKTAVKRAMRVSATELRREDVVLEVGALAEEVIVEARPLAVETEEGRVSGVLDERKIQELPLRGRSVYSLLALQPGVIGKNIVPDALSFAPALRSTRAGSAPTPTTSSSTAARSTTRRSAAAPSSRPPPSRSARCGSSPTTCRPSGAAIPAP